MLTVTLKRPSYIVATIALLTITAWVLFHDSSRDLPYNTALISSLFTRPNGVVKTHNEVFSVSTSNGQYFLIDFGDQQAMNPNIIPHPVQADTYIVVAQLRQETQFFSELSCNARLENDTLKCTNHAAALPIAPTFGDKCTGDLEYIGINKGPHDARVFYGPHIPYTIFGSNSKFACFGQFIQDFRTLVEWGYESFDEHDFVQATELQRPPPWGLMEKNWFLFFDQNDEAYLHYDVAPKRVFAKVESNGEVGPDMSPLTAAHDEKCIAKFMPKIGPTLESIHQTTNSLLITLCRRNDASCSPDLTNTFIFTIFQHKTYYNYHALYEPYLMVFEHSAPFRIHGISQKPFWIHGRKGWDRRSSDAESSEQDSEQQTSDAQKEEMFYVVSMSWKDKGQKYHGYIDDVLFVAFGIEDEQSAAIDVVAGDLFQDLGIC